MRKNLLITAALVAAAALSIAAAGGPARSWELVRSWIQNPDLDDTVTYWCPMDPEIVRKGVAMCPICNMELVVFEGESAGGGSRDVLVLTDRQVQQSGVRLGRASLRNLSRVIDASGRLQVPPERRSSLHIGYPGISTVDAIHVHTAGTPVSDGTLVLEVQNQGMLTRVQSYKTMRSEYTELRRQKLEVEAQQLLDRIGVLTNEITSFGLPASILDKIAASPPSTETTAFPVYANNWGIVLTPPSLTLGSTLRQNQLVLEAADLTELWLSVDLFESELAFVSPGQTISFTTQSVPDQVFASTIDFIEPEVQRPTQTVRAVARVSNKTLTLSPGLYVRASLSSDVATVLSVPESAVLQSGKRDVVLVAEGDGRFRPRIVSLGRRHLSLAPSETSESFLGEGERYHEILSGLHDGDRVVVAGAFLLNAEAQFQGILKKMMATEEAQQNAPALSDQTAVLIDESLDCYLAITQALVDDDARNLGELARSLAETTAVGRDDSALGKRLQELERLGLSLAASADDDDLDWDDVRTLYGSISREIVNMLAEHLPGRFGSGELNLFRCPMADDFGYELWVQRSAELQNPYMGQMMLECGSPAELP